MFRVYGNIISSWDKEEGGGVAIYTNEFSPGFFFSSNKLSTTLRRKEAHSGNSLIIGTNEGGLGCCSGLLPLGSLYLLPPHTHILAGDPP